MVDLGSSCKVGLLIIAPVVVLLPYPVLIAGTLTDKSEKGVFTSTAYCCCCGSRTGAGTGFLDLKGRKAVVSTTLLCWSSCGLRPLKLLSLFIRWRLSPRFRELLLTTVDSLTLCPI
jgi:hypothetical protein